MPSRRRLLLGVGGATAVGLAGCSARPPLDRPTPDARVEKIELINEDDAERRFALTVAVDGEVSYEATHVVAPADEEPIPVITEGFPAERGRLTVTTEIVGTGTKASQIYEEDGCFGVIVEYSAGGVTYYSGRNAEGCETTTS